MALDEDFISPQYHGHHLSLRMPTPTVENQPCLPQRSIPENTPSMEHQRQCTPRSPADQDSSQYPLHTNPVHDSSVPDSAHVLSSVQMPHNLGLWNPPSAQPGVLSIPCSSIAMNERHGSNMVSTYYPAHDLGQDVTHWDSYTTFDPAMTLWPNSPDRQALFPLVDHQISTLWNPFIDQWSAHPSHACFSPATPSHYPSSANHRNITERSIPHYSLPSQPFSLTSPHFHPHRTPTGFVEGDPHSYFPFYRVPYLESTHLSRPRRRARAIEYEGLLIDEEELLNGLTEPSGQLNVLQCHWEEDLSPCPLWIRGDKSCINAHIQKWHGGKLGGDKSQVDCRWSTCGKTMLKESIARHVLTIHLGETWECQGCGKEIVRNDAYGRHAVRSEFQACRTSGALITYSADVRVIDARAALDSAGRLLYAGA